jgi:hypothetical protein
MVDEAANFAFVQLIEQETDLHEKTYPEGQNGFAVGNNFT